MQIAPYDPSHFDNTVSVLDSMLAHRVQNPINKSDEMFYEMIADYFRAIRDADKLGKKLVYHTAMLPTEMFFAMDIVPAMFEMVATMVNLSNCYEEALATGKAYGYPAEICSTHRLIIGSAINGWLPRPDALVWSYIPCDITAKSNDNLRRLWGCPGHFIDRGHNVNKRELAYFTEELEEVIEFLEGVTGRKMDYDRLSECMSRTHEVKQLQGELAELKKITPSPLRGRAGMLTHMASQYMNGTQETVDLFRQLRDEAKQRVESGQGYGGEEKYRLLLFQQPPIYCWRIIDWLYREHGAVIVNDPMMTFWGPGDFDPARPVEALAKKTFIRTGMTSCGPIEPLLKDMVRGATEYNVDGVLTFSHVGCRQLTACNRAVKDAIVEATGLPFFNVEHDISDPSFCSEEELRERLEGFLEMLDERKR